MVSEYFPDFIPLACKLGASYITNLIRQQVKSITITYTTYDNNGHSGLVQTYPRRGEFIIESKVLLCFFSVLCLEHAH